MALKLKLLGRSFQKAYHIFCRVLCLVILLIQAALIDYYLIVDYYDNTPSNSSVITTTMRHFSHSSTSHHGHSLPTVPPHHGHITTQASVVTTTSSPPTRINYYSIIWVVADVGVFALFTAAFVRSYLHLKVRSNHSHHLPSYFGQLPLTYVSWFIHSATLCGKIYLIYNLPNSIALNLQETNFFGPNTLQTAVSLSSIVVYLLVLSHNDYKSQSKQNEFIQGLMGTIYLDVLDTTQFLGALTHDTDAVLTNRLDKVVLGIICFNYVLPTEALYLLSRSCYGMKEMQPKFQLLHKVCYFLVVNLPMFICRMLIWHVHQQSISVFLIKNILAIGMSIRDIHEFSMEVSEVILPSMKKREDGDHEKENRALHDDDDFKLMKEPKEGHHGGKHNAPERERKEKEEGDGNDVGMEFHSPVRVSFAPGEGDGESRL